LIPYPVKLPEPSCFEIIVCDIVDVNFIQNSKLKAAVYS